MTINQHSESRIVRMSTLVTLGLVILLACSQHAVGQWTTSSNGANNINNTNSGNVGIGTNAPDVRLQVHHSSSNNSTANIQLADLSFAFRNTSNTNGNMSLISFQDAGGWGNAQIGAIQVNQTSHVADLVFFTRGIGTFGERMRIKSDGNVGIGTTSPAARLHVLGGQIRATDNSGNGLRTFDDGTSTYLMSLTASDTARDLTVKSGNIFFHTGTTYAEKMRIDQNGNVGIGTSSPLYKLDVVGDIRTSGGIRFADGTVQTTAAGSGGGNISATNISAGQFGQNTGGGNYTFPSNVVVNGTINAKYQDMAEWVPTAHALPAATVVVLNPTQSNQVMASDKAYDTRVAGVISETPGLALGEGGPGKVLVATTGRVRVKVDASSGPIAIGDLLVTSDIPGVAMKSEPLNVGGATLHRPGTLIGKALEPLAKGKGEILVLLSLQ